MILIVAVLIVLAVATALALCRAAACGELRAALLARPADVNEVAARREREQHLRAAMRRHPAGKGRGR